MRKLIVIIAVTVACLLAFFSILIVHWNYETINEKADEKILVEVFPPFEVYNDRFLHHPEAWNKVFQNVSTIPEFWNATIPENLQNKAILQIAQTFSAQVSLNNADYAFCYISVPKIKCQALNQTLMQIGLNVKSVMYLYPNNASIFFFIIIS